MEPESQRVAALEAALKALQAAYFDAEGLARDFSALSASPERGRLAACLATLESFDPKQVRIAAQTAFWVNVFNAALLRDWPELDLASGERDVLAFLERPRLRMFGHRFSLDDIHHGLLRGNLPRHGRLRPPMARDDPRLAYMPIAYDERMHFALHIATRSSPGLRVFEPGRVDLQLEEAAHDYIRRTCRVERGGTVVVAPRLLQWYAQDFGGESGVLEFVLARLEDEQAVDMADRQRGKVKLQYAPYDWTLGRR
ncbi:MAG: DUF547 domain-containing protein [Burkholderiales bacterium]